LAQLKVPGVTIAPSDGRTAQQRAADDGSPTIVYDLVLPGTSKRVALCASAGVMPQQWSQTVASFQAAGLKISAVGDTPGMVVLRTMCMIVNEAYEAELCQVATSKDIDIAMTLGVNYPSGPSVMAQQIGLPRVVAALDAIHAQTGDPRYRASMGLRRAALISSRSPTIG
jgi:3-hydroxybutyryl-CoA dehydrogenase